MSFIGAMGVVAQQGNQSSAAAPTGVSIASSSSGNYDDALFSPDYDTSGYVDVFVLSADGFGNNAAILQGVSVGELATQAEEAGGITAVTQKYKGYIRATNATSFLWDLDITNSSLSNNCAADIYGTASTDQDETSNSTGDIGKYIRLTAGGGRGGITWPANNDYITMEFNADATNSGGTTSAQTLTVTYNFTT